MNTQEIFDKVVSHLRTQKQKSEAPNGLCRYRHGDLQCAAGVLIPDELYSELLEGRSWWDFDEKFYRDCGVEQPDGAQLVGELQMLHDSGKIEDWERGFRSLASEFSLEYSPPKEDN